MNDDVICRCELCHTPTVRLVRREGTGVGVWRCERCGDLKRWCPRCEQGWVRHFRSQSTGQDLYSCDECYATWGAPDDIHGIGLYIEIYVAQRVGAWFADDLLEIRDTESV